MLLISGGIELIASIRRFLFTSWPQICLSVLIFLVFTPHAECCWCSARRQLLPGLSWPWLYLPTTQMLLCLLQSEKSLAILGELEQREPLLADAPKLGLGAECFVPSHTCGIIFFPREEEVSAVLSKVPVGLNYLRRIVSSVHQDLLWHPRWFSRPTCRAAELQPRLQYPGVVWDGVFVCVFYVLCVYMWKFNKSQDHCSSLHTVLGDCSASTWAFCQYKNVVGLRGLFKIQTGGVVFVSWCYIATDWLSMKNFAFLIRKTGSRSKIT